MNRAISITFVTISVSLSWSLRVQGEENPGTPGAQSGPRQSRITRLYFQDHGSARVLWADALSGPSGEVRLSTPLPITNFKALDSQKQKLVQMSECLGCVLVGVRDGDDGSFESGWALFDGGVDYEEHGDHGHWAYARAPAVWQSRLDAGQGNPAHLYVYGDVFYLANDRKNGYTRIDPSKYIVRDGKVKSGPKAAFHCGGGNHITLAVAEQRVGYATWIDGGGPNRGRVDVTRIDPQGNESPAYSFHLPTGAIHGATVCEGRVFFAPADGVCWVEVDLDLAKRPEDVRVEHVTLGPQDGRPRRTGAFSNFKNYVTFVAGRDEGTSFVLLNARHDKPVPIDVPIQLKSGQKAVTPRIVESPDGRALALIFHDHDHEDDVVDELTIVDLDPDRNGECSDARIVKTLGVGRSAVEGHYGHHDVDFDADRRWAFLTNPGDGTISALSLKDLEIKSTLKVGGRPTALVTRGGRERDD